MKTNNLKPMISQLVWLVAILTGLLLGAGCSNSDVTTPSASSSAQLWVDEGAGKPATRIRFVISERAWISLTVRDSDSSVVRQLQDGILEAGEYSVIWNGRDDADFPVASGPYWAALTDGEGFEATAMMMIK